MDLAHLVDEATTRGALVAEGEATVVVSNLGVVDARLILAACDTLGWVSRCYDLAGNEWELREIDETFQPYRVALTKPQIENDILPIISNFGFQKLLIDGSAKERWWVARLAAPILTLSTAFLPWGSEEVFHPSPPTKNPRAVVHEYSADRIVPADVRPWILKDPDNIDFDDPSARIWASCALRAIFLVLPNEIEPETGVMKFRGPPRLSLTPPAPNADLLDCFPASAFTQLQTAVSWVFENEREAEARHALLATEIARSGGVDCAATECLKETIESAFDGARIAYEMSLAAIGADTLKALSDLRKAVTEETAKVTEATRQTIGAVTGALAVGLGLIAARLSFAADPRLIAAVMGVVCLYILMVIGSGLQFVLLQRSARKDWQPRLYRFLPQPEYKRLVSKPTGRAEAAFWTAAVGGIAAMAILAVVFLSVEPPRDLSLSKRSPGVIEIPVPDPNKENKETVPRLDSGGNVNQQILPSGGNLESNGQYEVEMDLSD